MSTAPRFLIAKYIPDLRRAEPRNIGVIVWSQGTTGARFIGEDTEADELKATPRFIPKRDKPVYCDWVAYWRLLLDQSEISMRNVGDVVRSSEQFVDALSSKSRDNFILVDGGVIFDAVPQGAILEAVDYLYKLLVAGESPDIEQRESVRLRRGWRRAIVKSGLKGHENFTEGRDVSGKRAGVERSYKFSAAIGNGQPEAVLQTVNLSHAISVNSAAFMFEAVRDVHSWGKDRMGAVVYAPAAHRAKKQIASALEQLDALSTLVNVVRISTAAKQIKEIGSPWLGNH